MRKTLLYISVGLIVAGSFSSCRKSVVGGGTYIPVPQPKPDPVELEEKDPAILTPVTHTVSSNIRGYYEAVPALYDETDKLYPVIIYFHGGGQYGDGSTQLPKVLEEGIPKLLNEKKFPPSFTVDQQKYSFIVVAPQLFRQVGSKEIDSLVNYVQATYRVDPERIYLSGFSLGARMLSNYAAATPKGIAAVTSMGGLPQIDSNLHKKCDSLVKYNVPIWHFHNKDDGAWPYAEAARYIKELKDRKPATLPLFTTFEVGEGRLQHDCWTRTTDPAYKENGKNIYEWMLQFKRPAD